MRFFYLWIILVLYALNVRCENATRKDFLDLNDGEDKVFLWKNLFIKLNTVLSETEKLSQNLLDVNKRLDDLTKRQEAQEGRLTKLMENVQEIREEEKQGQETHQSRLTKLIEDVQAFNKRQDSQEERLTELMKSVQETRMTEKRSQTWTVIQRRQDGSVNFYRNWNDYKTGFGNPNADFFIGLERLHQITTNEGPQELLIILIDFENETRYATYDLFRIGNETQKYAIMELGSYTGDAGDGMAHHRGQPFSTYDRDNNRGKIRNCPENFKGAWWFYEACYSGHLNGPYRQANGSKTWGVSWHPWRGWNKSMKYAAMMIRPKL